jgi:hypothetical protein
MNGGTKQQRQAALNAQVESVIPTGRKLLALAGVGGAGITGAAGTAAYSKKKNAAAARTPVPAPTTTPPKPPATIAPRQPQPIGKRDDDLDLEWSGTISKFDSDKRLVFGWASIAKVNGEPVIDRQGDYVPIETTEDAAYKYVIHSRKGGDMHRRVTKAGFGVKDEPLHTSDLVESVVVTQEKLDAWGLTEEQLPLGWWVGFKVHDDEQWDLVKAGKRPAFSIHGSGRRQPVPEHAIA